MAGFPPMTYPFDPTGLASTNKITGEIHTVIAASGPNLSFIVPRGAPFFSNNNLVIRKGPNSNSPLAIEGTDYILTHRFEAACIQTSKNIYGSIAFLNRTFTGQVRIDYQTVGGEWTIADHSAVETLTESLYKIRTILWDQVVLYPHAFPPYDHDHDADDIKGMSHVEAAINALTAAIMQIGTDPENSVIAAAKALLLDHISNTGTTKHNKQQVGLSLVENYSIATKPVAEAGAANDKYMTPLRVREQITALGLQPPPGAAGFTATGDVTGTGNLTPGTAFSVALTVTDSLKQLSNLAWSGTGSVTTIDPNTQANPFFVCRHANAPSNETGVFYFVWNAKHSNGGTDHGVQYAVEYRDTTATIKYPTRVAVRQLVGGAWTAWVWISNHQTQMTSGRTTTDPDLSTDSVTLLTLASATGGLRAGRYQLLNYISNPAGADINSQVTRVQIALPQHAEATFDHREGPSWRTYLSATDGWTPWTQFGTGGGILTVTDNLNDLKLDGAFDARDVAGITTGNNYPVVSLTGRLIVVKSSAGAVGNENGHVRQRYLVDGGLRTFERHLKNDGSWDNWVEVQGVNGAPLIGAFPVIPIEKGGTNATTVEQARTNLGLRNGATYNFVISETAPIDPDEFTIWLKPVY